MSTQSEINKPKRNFSNRESFAENLTTVFDCINSGVITVVSLITIVLISSLLISSFNWNNTLLEPIKVPDSLEKTGYTSDVLTKRVLDEIMLINTTSAKHDKKFSVKQPGDELAKLDSVSLAGTLDVRAIKTFIQDLFGIKHEKMTGEITAITVKDVTTYGVRIRLMPQDIVLVDLDEQLPIKDLIHLIALRIVEAKDPAVAASYYRRHHQDKESLRMIDKVLQDDDLTDDAYALTGRAHIYINQNKYKLAQEDLSSALKIDPQFPSALALQAQLFFSQKKFSEALAISKKEESLYPDRWQTYMNLGESYAGLEDKAQAQANFLKVISKKPRSSRIFEEIAHYFAKNGNVKQASDILSQGTLLFPHDPSLFLEFAKILAEENKMEEAKDALTKAYELDHSLDKLENEKTKTTVLDKQFILKIAAEFAKAHSGQVKDSVEDAIDNDLN